MATRVAQGPGTAPGQQKTQPPELAPQRAAANQKRQCHKNLHAFPSAMKSETQEEKELSKTTKLIFFLPISVSVYIFIYILYRPPYTLKKLKALTEAPKPHPSPHPG